jgi:hypothetical protein
MNNRIIVIAMTCMALMACAPVARMNKVDQGASAIEKDIQKELALQQQLKRQVRASRIGHPILRNAAAYCNEDVAPAIGALITSSGKIDEDMQAAAAKLWGVTDKPTVIAVLPGLPAEIAGLKPGDQILNINDQVLSGPLVSDPLAAIPKPYRNPVPISFTVIRDGAEVTTTVTPDPVCDYPIDVVTQDDVNAYADGRKIFITSGMMRFAESDDELATVIGHELGHNQMGHIKKKQGNQLLGILIGALITGATGVDVTNAVGNIGAGAFSQEFEAEADYVGMYHTARGGYDISASPNFWRRMGAEHPKAISHGATHPNTADRFIALDTTLGEITQKKETGEELVANMK